MTNRQNITTDDVFKAFSRLGQPPRWLLLDRRDEEWLHHCRVSVAVVMRDDLCWNWTKIGRAMNRNRANVQRGIEKYADHEDVLEMATQLRAKLGLEHAFAQQNGDSDV